MESAISSDWPIEGSVGLGPTVQEIVDRLSAVLDRAIAIDDAQLRLVAFSLHPYGVDTVRLDSILHRETAPMVQEWVMSHKPRDVDLFVRLGENSELDMRPRLCVPIRHGDIVLGFLWLIEEHRILGDAEIELAIAAAQEAGPVMHAERTLTGDRRARERQLLFALLTEEGKLAEAAATNVIAERLLASASAYLIAVIGQEALATETRDGIPPRVLGALDGVRKAAAPGSCLSAFYDGRGVLLLGGASAAESETAIERLVEIVAADAELVDWRIGIGAPVCDLPAAVHSFRTALKALRIALTVEPGGNGGPVWWGRSPAWRLISCLADDDVTAAALHPGVKKLAASRQGETLLETLETYLDLGGDARATAERLFMHRTSLYSRLQRIETIADVNLRDGEDRLALHMTLRLAALTSSSASDRISRPPGVEASEASGH